jgi:hypothetical protein
LIPVHPRKNQSLHVAGGLGPKPCPMAPTHTDQKSKPGMNGNARG